MEENIKKELLELNFRVSSTGITYWIDAIKIVKKTGIITMTDLYKYLALKNNSTASKIERCMRYALEPAKKNIQKKYRYYDEITCHVYLSLIKLKSYKEG